MSDRKVTISAKIPEGLRDKIDNIGREWGITNRSVLLRKALEAFAEKHGLSGIPTTESKIGEGDREGIGLKETCGIPQESGDSSSRNRRDEERR